MNLFYCIITLLLISESKSGEILDSIADFKDSLFNGLFGKSKCGCICRHYYVPKCEITYVEQCNTHYYEQVCEKVPVPVARQAKEIECQKCQKFLETVPITKYVKECSPVYDEKCHTDYHQHCKSETRCVTLYQTVCAPTYGPPVDPKPTYGKHKRSEGYGVEQHCQSQPREHCYPETKCHRTPDTQCVPVQKENCIKVPKETFVQQERKECLPFEFTPEQVEAMHSYDPCAGYQTGYGPPAHDHHDSSYSAPQSSYVVPQSGYSPPQSGYSPPQTGYSSPQTGYTPPHSGMLPPNVGHDSSHQQQFQSQAPVFHSSSPQQGQFQTSHQISDQQNQPSSQIRQVASAPEPSSPFPALPTYDGPDPILSIQEGLSNLFSVKRDTAIPQDGSYERNPFLRSSRQVDVGRNYDNGDWIPLVQQESTGKS